MKKITLDKGEQQKIFFRILNNLLTNTHARNILAQKELDQ